MPLIWMTGWPSTLADDVERRAGRQLDERHGQQEGHAQQEDRGRRRWRRGPSRDGSGGASLRHAVVEHAVVEQARPSSSERRCPARRPAAGSASLTRRSRRRFFSASGAGSAGADWGGIGRSIASCMRRSRSIESSAVVGLAGRLRSATKATARTVATSGMSHQASADTFDSPSMDALLGRGRDVPGSPRVRVSQAPETPEPEQGRTPRSLRIVRLPLANARVIPGVQRART